jgi:hypothetical protein
LLVLDKSNAADATRRGTFVRLEGEELYVTQIIRRTRPIPSYETSRFVSTGEREPGISTMCQFLGQSRNCIRIIVRTIRRGIHIPAELRCPVDTERTSRHLDASNADRIYVRVKHVRIMPG